jgi:hypothetical protein
VKIFKNSPEYFRIVEKDPYDKGPPWLGGQGNTLTAPLREGGV